MDLEGIIVDKAGYQSLKTGLRKSNGFTEADIAQLRKVCTASNITDSYLGLREKELALSPATVTSKRGDSPVSEAGTHVSSNAQGDTTSDADQDKHLPASAPVIGAENIINALTHAQGLGKINSATIYKLKNGLEIKLDPKNYLDGFAKSAYKLMAAAEDGKPRWVDRDVLFPTSEKGFSEVDRMSKHFVNAKEVREVDAVSVNTTETKKPPSKRISSQGNNYALYYCAKAQIAKELENPKIHADEKEKLVLGLVTAAKELTVPLDLSELDLQDVNLDAVREIMLIVSPDKAESTNPNGTRKSDNERTLNEGVTVDALKNAADLSKTINLMPTLINGMNISDNTKAMIHAVRGANLSNVIFDFPVWYRHYQHFVEVKTSHCDLFEKLNSLYPKAKKFSNYFDAEEYAKKNPQGDTAKAINNINYGLLYESFNLKTLTVNDIKLLIDTAKTSNIKLYLKDCKLSGDLTEIDLSKADLTGCTFDFLKDQDRVFQDQNTTITGEQVALFVKAGVTDFSNITIIGKIPKSVVVKKGPDESNKLDFSRSNLKDATFESFITYESIKAEGLSNAELSRDQVRQMAAGGVEMQTKLSKAKFTAENTAGVNLSGVSKLKVDTKNEFSPPDATLSNSVVAQLKAADGRPKANAAQTSGTGKITAPEKYIVQNTYKLPINRGTAPKTNVEKTPLADDRVFVSSMAKKLVVKVRADTIPDLKNTSLKYTDPTKTDLGERITLYSAILDEKKIDKTQCVVIDPNAAPTTDVTTQSDALQVIPLSSAIDTDLSTAITAIYTALASGKTFIIASQEGKNTGENDVQAVAPKLTNTSLAEALSALALEFTDLRTFRKNLDNLVVFVKWIDSKGGVDVLRKMTEVNRNVMIDAALTEKINASSFSLFNTKYDEPVAKIYKGMDGSEKNVFNGFIAAFKNGLDVKPVDRSEPVVGRGLSIMAPKN
ncbi:MAG: hypothetical protein NTZ67_06375 [Gammaproteobacteria bacterium]|nr:hypothetical protein [Gammaproteobacteria bacterium]